VLLGLLDLMVGNGWRLGERDLMWRVEERLAGVVVSRVEECPASGLLSSASRSGLGRMCRETWCLCLTRLLVGETSDCGELGIVDDCLEGPAGEKIGSRAGEALSADKRAIGASYGRQVC
jgi:hypothetical protein